MQRILLFISKYNGFFSFIILQFVALSLYLSSNINDNKLAFITSANNLVGNVFTFSNSIYQYWNLSTVNEKLARENALLKMRLPSSKFSSLVPTTRVVDTTLQQQYEFISARVVRNTVHRLHNFITINKGRKQGIEPGMGVLNQNGQGVVGIVYKASDNFSVIISSLNIDMHLSAKISRNKYFGTMTWEGKDPRRMLLESIPKHADMVIGDTIVTSGYSSLFPEGIILGYVDTFYQYKGENYFHTEVQLNYDFNTLDFVYVVNDLLRSERIELENR